MVGDMVTIKTHIIFLLKIALSKRMCIFVAKNKTE